MKFVLCNEKKQPPICVIKQVLYRVIERNIFERIQDYRRHKERLAICRRLFSLSKFRRFIKKCSREYIQYSLRFLFHLTKNLTTHLSHNLCAVLP